MPGLALGTITSRKRRHGGAPSEDALSSSVLTSIAANTAITERTMKGSVKTTWPATMNIQERRKSLKPP